MIDRELITLLLLNFFWIESFSSSSSSSLLFSSSFVKSSISSSILFLYRSFTTPNLRLLTGVDVWCCFIGVDDDDVLFCLFKKKKFSFFYKNIIE
jgi:hypothetical protein